MFFVWILNLEDRICNFNFNLLIYSKSISPKMLILISPSMSYQNILGLIDFVKDQNSAPQVVFFLNLTKIKRVPFLINHAYVLVGCQRQ